MPNTRIVHFIPPAKFAEIETEFVNPVPDDYFIWWLFRYRCMECKRPGQEINEIILRSRSKSAIMNWKNRVVLCRDCHTKYHQNGVSKEKQLSMTNNRIEYLKSIGRLSYL